MAGIAVLGLSQDWVNEAKLGKALRFYGIGDAVIVGLFSLFEPWGGAPVRALVALLPLALALLMAWKPSWMLCLILIVVNLALGWLAFELFRDKISSTPVLCIGPVLIIAPAMWRGRAFWRVMDLSPSIQRLSRLLKVASRDPELSVRFAVGSGRSQRRIRAIRVPHYWYVQIQGAERNAGLIPLDGISIEMGFGGSSSCRFMGPGYVSPLRGACTVNLENLHRFEKLMRERP